MMMVRTMVRMPMVMRVMIYLMSIMMNKDGDDSGDNFVSGRAGTKSR